MLPGWYEFDVLQQALQSSEEPQVALVEDRARPFPGQAKSDSGKDQLPQPHRSLLLRLTQAQRTSRLATSMGPPERTPVWLSRMSKKKEINSMVGSETTRSRM